MEFEDLTGQKFSRLTVVREVARPKNSKLAAVWYCICDCGKETVVFANNLKRNHTKSCGCLQSENMRKISTTHGLRSHKLYKIWHGMIERCYKEKATSYPNYGARGITVCERWKVFKNFYDDMIDDWILGLQIDRINYNGNYEKSNCRWATPKQNCRNRRTIKLNECMVKDIRASNKPTKELMVEYDVCKSTINNIKTNVSWN